MFEYLIVWIGIAIAVIASFVAIFVMSWLPPAGVPFLDFIPIAVIAVAAIVVIKHKL